MTSRLPRTLLVTCNAQGLLGLLGLIKYEACIGELGGATV